MKNQKVLKNLFSSIQSKLSDEIGGLLDRQFTISPPLQDETSKETFFEEAGGKLVMARLAVSGDRQGEAYIFVSVPDAIRLGGVLIMLPEAELNNRIKSGEYSDEQSDAFGEIANILTGILTTVFEENLPHRLHLKMLNQEVVVPSKVDSDSDQPFPEQPLIQATFPMTLEGKELSPLNLLFPAPLLSSEKKSEAAKPSPAAKEPVTDMGWPAETAIPSAPDQTTAPAVPEQEAAQAEPASAAEEPAPTPEEAPVVAVDPAKLAKKKKQLENVLKLSGDRICEEVGVLIDTELTLAKHTTEQVTKEQFFSGIEKKQALAQLTVKGGTEGQAYLLVSIRDAIRLGGTLIMLPEAELGKRIKAEEYSEEQVDAFGEVANIITGVFATAFDENYPEKLHLKMTGQTQVNPVKVDEDSDEPFPPGEYLAATYIFSMDGNNLDPINLVFPLNVLGIQQVAPGKTAAPSPTLQPGVAQPSGKAQQASADGSQAAAKPMASGPPSVLIIAENEQLAEVFSAAAQELKIQPNILGFKDNFRDAIANNQNLSGIFLVMREVNEQGFAATIKIKSAAGNQVPVIAAGPEWTRKTVIQAVKYGVCDIVVTPAENVEIQAKIKQYMKK